MNRINSVMIVLTAILVCTPAWAQSLATESGPAAGETSLSARQPEAIVSSAAKTLEQMQRNADRRISPSLIDQAAAVLVFPDLSADLPETGMIEGDGILIARRSEGWSLPVFVRFSNDMTAAEAGASRPRDLILIVNDTETIRQVADGFDFILGSDATVAAGRSGDSLPEAQVVAYASRIGHVRETLVRGATLTLESGPLEEYYHLNQDAVREYFGEEEQLVRQFLGLDQEINADAQGIDYVPESARILQQRLKEYGTASE